MLAVCPGGQTGGKRLHAAWVTSQSTKSHLGLSSLARHCPSGKQKPVDELTSDGAQESPQALPSHGSAAHSPVCRIAESALSCSLAASRVATRSSQRRRTGRLRRQLPPRRWSCGTTHALAQPVPNFIALLACLTMLACQADRQAKPQKESSANPAPSPDKPQHVEPPTAPSTVPRYRVFGVARDDVLNLRATAGAQAAIVATLPPNATGLEPTGRAQAVGATTWRELRYQGTVGWVNERYLAAESSTQSLPTSLVCFGTEPFWSLELNTDGTARCIETCQGPDGLKISAYASNLDRTTQTLDVITAGGALFLQVQIKQTGDCSDGMSDLKYPFLLKAKGPATDLNGCCRLPTPKLLPAP